MQRNRLISTLLFGIIISYGLFGQKNPDATKSVDAERGCG
jgi:hypothetical protein